MKKIAKFLSSMPFALGLLGLLAAACALCSAIPQGLTLEEYAARYGERTAGLMMALRLDDAFHSWWFVGLSGLLCLNLLCCNLIRLPALVKRTRNFSSPNRTIGEEKGLTARGTEDPAGVFGALGLPERKKDPADPGDDTRFSARGGMGLWGAWVCHLGILLLILGFALGQMTTEQDTVYALPGQTKTMEGTGLEVTVEDLAITRNPDGTVAQYASTLRVTDPAQGRVETGVSAVNAPASLFGYQFFQNSVGWGADVTVQKDGRELQREALCAGEFFPVQDKPELVIYFPAFYPDGSVETGSQTAIQVTNPGYLYQVFYQGNLLGMNLLRQGEELTIDEYTVTFDNPRNYTLLAVKRDRFTWLVLLGGLVTLAGLVLAFWVQPRAAKAIRNGAEWILTAECRKGGALFRETFAKAAEEAGYRLWEPTDGTDESPEKERKGEKSI